MKYRALVSFSGALSMHQGEVRELNNKATIKDLLKAKYIEEVKEKPNKEEELQDKINLKDGEIEELKKQIAELTKVKEKSPEPQPPVKPSGKKSDKPKKPKKDVKPDESKPDNSK